VTKYVLKRNSTLNFKPFSTLLISDWISILSIIHLKKAANNITVSDESLIFVVKKALFTWNFVDFLVGKIHIRLISKTVFVMNREIASHVTCETKTQINKSSSALRENSIEITKTEGKFHGNFKQSLLLVYVFRTIFSLIIELSKQKVVCIFSGVNSERKIKDEKILHYFSIHPFIRSFLNRLYKR
jgi:hypothetical protein